MTNEENRFFLRKIVAVNISLIVIQDMYEKGEITKGERDIYFKDIEKRKKDE